MKKIKVIGKNLGDKKKSDLDFGMLIAIIVLLCFGLIMVSSASSYHALSTYNNSSYLLTRQLLFALGGVVAMFIISRVDYRLFARWSYIFFGIALVLLLLVLTPLGVTRNGATRWLGFGSVIFQPSEIMKIALVLITATYISKNYKKMNGIKGYLVPIGFLASVMLVMFLQKHMSGTLVMVIASLSIIFASRNKNKSKIYFSLTYNWLCSNCWFYNC